MVGALGSEVSSRTDSGTILGRFVADFGSILRRSWADFWSMFGRSWVGFGRILIELKKILDRLLSYPQPRAC